jgi:hypothetical protein
MKVAIFQMSAIILTRCIFKPGRQILFCLKSKVIREIKSARTITVFILVSVLVCNLSCVTITVPSVYARDNNFAITEYKALKASNGNLIVVGSVLNAGKIPAEIQMGYNITDKTNGSVTTLKTPVYSKITYPFEVVPFKFIINSSVTSLSAMQDDKPFIFNVTYRSVPKYDNIAVLNYSSFPTGNDKALIGTIKNNSPFDISHVVLYASARSKTGMQIDSVKSSMLPFIKAGQTLKFSTIPEPSIRSEVYSYSCVGADLQDAMSYKLLEVGQKQTVGYKLTGLATVDDIRYVNSTDSLTFKVNNYYPTPGPMNLIIMPQLSAKQHISLAMDGKVYTNGVRTNLNGKEILIDFLVPQGKHDFRLIGISRVKF